MFRNKLSVTDEKIQVVVQGLVEHLIDARDKADEIHLTSAAGDYGIQVDITETNIQILVAHLVTNKLYAWTSFIKETGKVGINFRHELLGKYLNDLILLEKMHLI